MQWSQLHPFPGLDVLICNAGGGRRNPIRDLATEDFDFSINLNLRSCFVITKYALPHLEKTKGNIVFISSALGLYIPFLSSCPNFFKTVYFILLQLKEEWRDQQDIALPKLAWITLPAAWLLRRLKMESGWILSALVSFLWTSMLKGWDRILRLKMRKHWSHWWNCTFNNVI